jgi:predicted DNA-binding transcriptional regulator AlpA
VIQVDGERYVLASDIAEELGISRQTLWRWRQENKIPQGHRYRDRHVVFSEEDVERIRRFANKIEPILPSQDG